tara:strand:- start:2874 stop:4175 length:1302 start_codon:yes stop_codon:yes gene_type:complete
MERSNTFCIMPFVHQNLKQEGRVTACWRAQGDLGNSTHDSLLQIFNSNETKELRRALLNGERPEGCRSCWDTENANIESTRQQCLTNWKFENEKINFADGAMGSNTDNTINLEKYVRQNIKEDYSYPVNNLKSIEVRFDNICNLMCRHCSPVYSSLWEKAVKKMPSMQEASGGKRRETTHISLTENIVNEIELLAPSLQEILITGGEPLYHTKHYDFLKNLEPYAENIILNYNSNFTTLEYAGKSILPLWKKFKKVGVLVSLDACPDIYPYVRVYGKIDKVEKNIKTALQELHNINLQSTCTTSVLNITRLVDVFKYYVSLRTGVHTSIVQYPSPLNPRVLPKAIKDKATIEWDQFCNQLDSFIDSQDISEKFKDYYKRRLPKVGGKMIKYMNSRDEYDPGWKSFIEFAKIQDTYHKTNILDYYPEFTEYWDA